ncbi:hypothetical protein [Spirillospora sp. CA-294931]|uniref:hypothetical protein n=1 Tax=Spirillospora sp. CA-294931 TaxID=3240042 RepID=UPI003D91EA8F
MTTPVVGDQALVLSGHPLQRCGGWALTLLAGRDDAGSVSAADIEDVAERVIDDVVAAATAAKDSPTYDWWKVLFALYPNSKPTHAKRPRESAVLRESVAELFAPDDPRSPLLPCTFCSRWCGTLWSKSVLPMFESIRALNTLPPGVAGWPICRACRVALWALPYAAWVTAGSATVLTCDDPAVERDFAMKNVQRSGRIRQLGFVSLPAGRGPEAVVLQALREHAGDAGGATTLWAFKNDNQEPWLHTASTRLGVARFLRAVRANPDCHRGWAMLKKMMRRRDGSGALVLDGSTAAARLLFDREGHQGERLPAKLMELARDPDALFQHTLLDWRALCRLYLEVMYDMETARLRPAASLLADWIAKEGTRGRFNEFRQAVTSPYNLSKLLMTASARLFLDGGKQEPVNHQFAQLCTDGPQGWRVRGQLYFDVMAELINRGVQVGKPGSEELSEADDADQRPGTDDDEDGYA